MSLVNLINEITRVEKEYKKAKTYSEQILKYEYLISLKSNYHAISGYSWEQRKDIDVYVNVRTIGDKI